MNAQQHDPLFDSLDRLAGLADADPVGDRIPGIQRRVRAARRRKGAGLVAAAAVLAVGGAGLWQALPNAQTPPPVTDPVITPSQQISVDAQAAGPGRLRVSFTVTGESTEYVDSRTGDPSGYAGPLSTEVAVDGKLAALQPPLQQLRARSGPEKGDLVCEPGGELTPYTMRFHTDEPLVVQVPTAGAHEVVVSALYCAEGELVESVGTVVVTTEAAALRAADRRRADVDGDGTDEVVTLLWPTDVNGEGNQLLRVEWGTGETTEAALSNEMESRLAEPVDLDRDGELELVVGAGGGDLSVYWVFLADVDALEKVRTVDPAGGGLGLHSDADPSSWRAALDSDGFSSYRLADPAATQFPAPVEVRRWSLSGRTLTLSEESDTRCATFQPTFTLGPC